MKFRKPKEQKLKVTPLSTVKRNRRLKAIGIFLICLFFITLGYLLTAIIIEYKDTHTFNFQSPIVFQKPVIIERNLELYMPVSTQSGMMKAYAQEVKNPFDPKSPKGIGWELVKEKWGIDQWGYFEELVQRESGWNPYSVNPSSGSCYLPQALPCSKLNAEPWDYEAQLKWMVDYIDNRYGTPSKAIEFHNEMGWY